MGISNRIGAEQSRVAFASSHRSERPHPTRMAVGGRGTDSEVGQGSCILKGVDHILPMAQDARRWPALQRRDIGLHPSRCGMWWVPRALRLVLVEGGGCGGALCGVARQPPSPLLKE